MIYGIPYFGEDNNSVYNKILTQQIKAGVKYYSTLLDLINALAYKKVIVIIDNKWLTWLHDIVFNYRDKECYIPYFEYKTHKINDKDYRSDNKGHLILNKKECSIDVRYEYNYKKLDININKVLLLVYDLETNEKYRVATDKWCDDTFSIDELYNYYIDSSYEDDDFKLNKHIGGYHYIFRAPDKFNNREKKLRSDYYLKDLAEDIWFNEYRDVRKYKYNEVIQKEGMRDTCELHEYRRLRFESTLYCILRQHSISDNEHFNKQLKQLGVTKDYIKYGNNIKLIFKSYWLDEYRPIKKYSWSRV